MQIFRYAILYRNSLHQWYSCFLGGYDLLGRTKDQIRTKEQVNAALKTCLDLKLDGLVIIGGKFRSLALPCCFIHVNIKQKYLVFLKE